MSKFKTAVKAKVAQARASQTPAFTLAKIIKNERFGKETATIRAELMTVLESSAPWLINAPMAISLVIKEEDRAKLIFQEEGRTIFRRPDYKDATKPAHYKRNTASAKLVAKRKSVDTHMENKKALAGVAEDPGVVIPMKTIIADLSTRAQNVLAAWEITSIAEAKERIDELKKTAGCGPKTIAEILAA